MSKTCEKCIHHDVCRYPLEGRANPDTCWKYEEERQHGEWIEKPWGVVCSRCKAQAPFSPNGHQLKSDFCPDCGALFMREGEAE